MRITTPGRFGMGLSRRDTVGALDFSGNVQIASWQEAGIAREADQWDSSLWLAGLPVRVGSCCGEVLGGACGVIRKVNG